MNFRNIIVSITSAICLAAQIGLGANISRFVEYVESDGVGSTSGEYVLLDYVPTSRSIVETRLVLLKINEHQGVFCARGNDIGVNTFSFFHIGNQGFRWDYNTISGPRVAAIVGSNYLVRCTSEGFWLDGNKVVTVSPANYTPANKMMLFASYTCQPTATPAATGNYSKMRLYSFKAWDDNGATLRVDLYPCVDSNGTAALYDAVTDTLYYNLKSGKSLIASTTEAAGPAKLIVAGAPDEYGTPSPGYGLVEGWGDGATVTLSCPAAVTNGTSTFAAECAGWTFRGTDHTETSGAGTQKTLSFSRETQLSTLTWRWIEKSRVTVAAGAHGTVTTTNAFFNVGSEVAATATPDEGYAFAGWTGLPAEAADTNPLRFTLGVETNGVALTARFCPTNDTYAIDLAGGDQTIEVAAGCVHTVSGVTGDGTAKLTVVGGGLLVMPDEDLSSTMGNLVIDGVMVQISSESQLGSGTVTIRNGGGLLCTEGFTQAARKITIEAGSTGIVEVASGKTVVFTPTYFVSASATLVKQGAGTLQMKDTWKTAQTGSSRWIAEAGSLYLYGSFDTAPVVEIHESGTFLAGRNVYDIAVGAVTMRGGKLIHNVQYYDPGKDMLHLGSSHLKLSLGTVTVVPSLDGSHSYIATGLFSGGGRSDFNVKDGAVLDLDSALQPTGRVLRSLRKTGGGTLRLLKSPFSRGGIEVLEGTLALAGHNVRLPRGVPFHVADGARIVLENGAVLDQTPEVPSALLAEAGVWIDATQLRDMVNGSSVATIPNLGTAGGIFTQNSPSSPTIYSLNALNGMPAFDNPVGGTVSHGRGLAMVGAYSHTGSELSTYMVAKATNLAFNGNGYGKSSTPFAFGTKTGSSSSSGGFRYEYISSNQFNVYFAGNNVAASKMAVSNDAVSIANGMFISATRRDATTASLWQYRGDGVPEFTQELTGQTFANYNIANMGLFMGVKDSGGGIWGGGGQPVFVGQIGELLVFSRKLTDNEDEAVRGYLAKKWFGSTREWAPLPTNSPAQTLPVTVAAGDTAGLGFDRDASSAPFAVAKEGEGELIDFSSAPGGRTLDVREGRAAFSPTTRFLCPAALWLDAADPTALSTNAEGVVLSVRNKGHAGGEFLPRTAAGSADCTPIVGDIGGKTAVRFTGDDFLRTYAFTNSTPRELYVYLVRQRDAYVGNAGFFVYLSSEALANANDVDITGSITAYESGDKSVSVDAGSVTRTAGFSSGAGANGVPVIDYFYIGDYRALAGELAEDNTPTNVVAMGNLHAANPSAGDRNARNDIFHIGSRLGKGDVPKTFMNGRIGELLAFEEPLNATQTEDLVAYFRKKWMGKGTGSETPPRWLAQEGLEVETGGRLVLRQAEGTELGQDGGTVSLASYTAEGEVAWTRDAALGNALFSVAGDLAFGGPVDLALNPFPRKGYSRTLATYGGECTGFASGWTLSGEGMRGNPEVKHHTAEKSVVLEFVSPATILFVR